MRFLTALLITLLFSLSASAQDNDMRSVMSRLDQVQRQMDTISRQVYSGNPPPAALSNPSSAGNSSDVAAAYDERMSSIEGSIRDINNRLDEQDYAIGQLKQQFDLFKSDLDVRLKEIGSNAAVSAAANEANTASITPSTSPAPQASAATAAAVAAADASAANTLKGGNTAKTEDADASQSLPTDSAAALYDAAFQYLREQKYPEAQNGFKEFMKRYPTDTLAGNAQYWLGETYYAQGNYAEASKAFATGYQKYPKSNKAPDNLLKLGLSLAQAGKKQAACTTFQQLGTQYKNAAAVIKQRATEEAQKLSCGGASAAMPTG